MKRLVITVTVVVLAVASGGALATASPGRHSARNHRFVDHLIGATVQSSAKRSVGAFAVTTNDVGPGAAVTKTRAVSATAGTFTSVSYFPNGSVRSAGRYEARALPGAAPGVVSVTLMGHLTGGTGVDQGAQGQFRGTGTNNTMTKAQSLTVTGTITP
jgi:hypothetical protein